jgi:hypothetical protein
MDLKFKVYLMDSGGAKILVQGGQEFFLFLFLFLFYIYSWVKKKN